MGITLLIFNGDTTIKFIEVNDQENLIRSHIAIKQNNSYRGLELWLQLISNNSAL